MTKRTLLKAGSLLLILALCFSVIGCGDKKEKKYELAFKVVIEGYDNEIIMMPEDNGMQITLPCDGEKHRIEFFYQKLEHPQQGDIWFTPISSSEIDSAVFLMADDEDTQIMNNTIEDPGTYLYLIRARKCESWNSGYYMLYINLVEEKKYD